MSTPEKHCPACGSTQLMPDLSIVDHGDYNMKHKLAIEIDGKPQAFLFRDTERGVFRACVCGDCGHVELAVENPQALLEAYRKNAST